MFCIAFLFGLAAFNGVLAFLLFSLLFFYMLLLFLFFSSTFLSFDFIFACNHDLFFLLHTPRP